MTTIEAPDLYEVVSPPIGAPYRFGLFSVVDFTNDGGPHIYNGSTWESEGCADVRATQNACVDPDVEALTGDQCGTVMAFNPFALYRLDTSSIGGQSLAEHSVSAQTRFTSGEQTAAEEAVADIIEANAPAATVVDSGTEPTVRLLSVLATVEQALAEMTGSEGVVYMSRFAASMLSGVLVASGGNTLRTALGTRVAAMGGGDLGSTMYGTGPINAQRATIDVSPNTPDRSVNDASVLVQRTYVFGFDCGAVAATTTL